MQKIEINKVFLQEALYIANYRCKNDETRELALQMALMIFSGTKKNTTALGV